MTTGRSKYILAAGFLCVCGLAALAWFHLPQYIDLAAAAKKINMKQKLFPTRMQECPVDAILCGEKFFGNDSKSSDLKTLRSEFHRLITTIDFHCPTLTGFGVGHGYPACMTKAIRANNNSCLVYSFGIANDWSFDEAWAEYGCEVHSFDPSIGKQDHMHAPNISFHNLGIWGTDYTNSKGWKLEKLSTIKKRLGHEKRIIDALKIDAEGAEWPFLRDVVYTDPTSLSNVRQLYMELHTPRLNTEKGMTAADFAEINDYVRRLRDDRDFLMYKNVHTYNCCHTFADLMPPGIPDKCCHEVHFFNPRLLRYNSLL